MKHIFTVLFFATLMGCGGKKIVIAENSTVKADGVMSLSVAWVKDKGKKYDIRVTLRNESSEQGAIVYLSDIACFKGDIRGEAKHTFFNTGERTIDFKPAEAKTFNLVCRLGAEATGAMRLTIAKVYENTTLDGKTAGKVVASNMEWKSADSSAAPAAVVP